MLKVMPTAKATWVPIAIAALLLAVLIASVSYTITLGPLPVTSGQVWGVVAHHLGIGSMPDGVSELQAAAVWRVRVPRALLAALAGAGLALCGALLQSLLRNPLADPYILGISSGASVGAVAVIVLGAGVATVGLTGGAFIGGVAAFAMMLGLARLAGGTTDKIILAGVAATQLFSALTSLIVMVSADAETTRGVLFWMLGSLASTSWADVFIAACVVGVAAIAAMARSAHLDAFTFGEDSAATLGVDVAKLRFLLLTLTAAVTATLVASSGAIGFVGLVVPHIARILVGPVHRTMLPMTVVVGAILLVWVDALARTIAAPQEIPVGVFTAIIGVPAFIAVLLHASRKESTR